MNRTLYVSDLDGTLLSPEAVLTPVTVRMLNEAISLGAMFTCATARTPATVSVLLRGVDMRLPAAVMTGSALWNPSDGRFSSMRFMKPDAVADILGCFREAHLPVFLYTLSGRHLEIYHSGPLSERERVFINERRDSPYKDFFIHGDGDSAIPDHIDNALLFFCMQPTEDVEKVYGRLLLRDDCRPVFYHDMYGPEVGMMEVFSPGASKAAAVEELVRLTGADRVVAFGDNVNDLPLLRRADVAVAVSNAVAEVKAEADVVIGANTEDAVARFILESVKKERRGAC